jgi:hypothetical protein
MFQLPMNELIPRTLLLAILLAMVGGGCSMTRPNKEQAVAAARQEMLRRGWHEMELQTAAFEAGRWQVSFWRLPKVPGGHATVQVSRSGQVLGVLSGR